MSDTRQHAHELIDRLPDSQLSALVGLLESMVDPASIARAPLDDEIESDDERLAVADAREWLDQHGGKGVPHKEAMRRLGLG